MTSRRTPTLGTSGDGDMEEPSMTKSIHANFKNNTISDVHVLISCMIVGGGGELGGGFGTETKLCDHGDR